MKASVHVLHGRFLLVFTGFPRTSEHEQEPFVLFLCMDTCRKNGTKVLQKIDMCKSRMQKGLKRTLHECKKSCTFAN